VPLSFSYLTLFTNNYRYSGLLVLTAFFFASFASTYTFSEVFIVSSSIALSSSTVVSEVSKER